MIDWMNPSDDVLEARRIGYDEAAANMDGLQKEIESLRAEVGKWRRQDAMHMGELRDLHKQLAEKDERIEGLMNIVMEVSTVYPGETREETALRYVRERERRVSGPAQEASDE